MSAPTIPCVMTIAGSDSGGGAGIQADLRTFHHFRTHGTCAITAVTAQNPCEVRRIDPLPPESVKSQIEAVLAEFPIAAIKTGMLFNEEIIKLVSESIEKLDIPLVVDPVMVATSGAVLLEKNAVQALMERILPLADCITPNIPEAEILSGISVCCLEDARKAAQICSEKWNCTCVVKGGHSGAPGDKLDIVAMDGNTMILRSPSAGTSSLHGTGCSFSAAICACLGRGMDISEALLNAKAYIYGSIAESFSSGKTKSFRSLYPPQNDYSPLASLETMN